MIKFKRMWMNISSGSFSSRTWRIIHHDQLFLAERNLDQSEEEIKHERVASLIKVLTSHTNVEIP